MKSAVVKIYLALTTLEGAAALIFIFRPAAAGPSAIRMMLGLFTLGLVLIFAALTVLVFINSPRLNRVDARLQRWLGEGHRLLILTLTLAAGMLMAIALVILWYVPQIHEYGWYGTVFKPTVQLYELLLVVYRSLLPLIGWAALFFLQTLLLLFLSFASRYRQRDFWDGSTISRTLLVLAMLGLCLFQWSVLALQVPIHKLLPTWYWNVNRRPFDARLLLFLFLLGLSLAVTYYIIRHPQRLWLSMLMLIGLGYLLQLGFGVIQGSGYEYIRSKYADSKHRSYSLTASGDPTPPLAMIREYEQRYGQKIFPGTKPPGLLMVYLGMERVVNLVRPEQTSQARFLALTQGMAYTWPLISFLVVGAIYLLVRPLVRQDQAAFPSILYIFVPSVILLPLFLDQVLYPLLFVLGIWLMWRVVQSRSVLLAVLAGVYFYISAFISFSLLPLLPFFFVLLGLQFLLNRKYLGLLRAISLVAGVTAGVLALFLLFRYSLNYDFFQRYDTAMRVHVNTDFVLRTGEKVTADLSKVTVQPSIGQILRASFLNNLEFAAAIGFPIFLLFLWRTVRTLAALLRRRATPLDVLLGSLVLTYIAFNLYGHTQGEVTRLWIFWVPMMVIFAGVELASLFRRMDWALYFVIILQLITILMTFQFQDFIV